MESTGFMNFILRKGVRKMYWLTAVLGIAMLIAPFVVGYVENTVATLVSLAVGAVVLVMSGLEAVNHERERWEYGVALMLGLVTVIAPFIFGFSNHAGALWTSVFLGVLIAITAGSKIYTGHFR